MSEKFHNPTQRLARPAVRMVVLVAALAGAAAVVAQAAGHGEQAAMALSTAAICTLSALVALLPMAVCREIESVPAMCMASMSIRLLLSVAGVAALAVLGAGSTPALGFWAMGWYLLLLMVEVWMFVRLLGGIASRPTQRKEAAAC